MPEPKLATAPVANDVFPHPMLDGYPIEERRAMLGVRAFLERFLRRRPTVTEVVFAYHVMKRMDRDAA